MRILFVSSNSLEAYLDIEREQRALLKLARSGNHSLHLLPAATEQDIRDELSRQDAEGNGFDVLHFSGHGTIEEGIILKAEDGAEDVARSRSGSDKTDALDEHELRRLLSGQKLKLVILNACQTKRLVESIAGDGEKEPPLADAIIGTSRKVDDWRAIRFTSDFYAALNNGSTVNEAYRKSKGKKSPYLPPAGSNPDITLPRPDMPGEGQVEGLGAFYQDFYGKYIDEQINGLKRDRRLNNYVFYGLVAIAVCVWVWLLQKAEYVDESPVFSKNLQDALEQLFALRTKDDEPINLFSIQALWERIEALDTFAPVLIAFFQKRIIGHTGPKLEGLQRLKDSVKKWDNLPEADREMVRSVMHTSIEEALKS